MEGKLAAGATTFTPNPRARAAFATSGLMATTGTEDVHPIKFGSPAVDYGTGTMPAFALATWILSWVWKPVLAAKKLAERL